MTTCNQDINSFSGCNCSTIYYQNQPTPDYSKVLSITSVPYNTKVTTEADQGLLPLRNNKLVNFIKCSLYNEDDRTSYFKFLLNITFNTIDGNNITPSVTSLSKMKLRCLEDIWLSPLGDAFSLDSQDFVYNFIRLQNLDYSVLWTKIISKVTTSWVYGSGNAIFPSDRRAAIWWWLLPNNIGYSDPPNLIGKRLSLITEGGFPYKMYSYDSLEFSSYCPLYTYYSQSFNHYYTINNGTDPNIIFNIGNDNSWYIRYIPEASPGSIYIKWPSFIQGQGSTTEAILRDNFLPFYNAMIQIPTNNNIYSKPTWIMRIGLEYIKRVNGFLAYPEYMRNTLQKIYEQYIDIKSRLCYLTLYQILQARYSGESIINGSTDNIYLSQYISASNNLSYTPKSIQPILNDGIDPNSLLGDSGYPLSVNQNTTIVTAFTEFELGVFYTSAIRSSSTLIFKNPNSNPDVFGNILIYTKTNGYATTVSDSTSLKTLTNLFGVNGTGTSYLRPEPRIIRILPPFDATDPNIITPISNNKSILSNINYYTILYILIVIIVIILVIGIIIYIIKRKKYITPDIPELYRTGKYGHLIYDEI